MNTHITSALRKIQFLILGAVAFCVLAPEAKAQYSYFPLTPCRVVDTRGATGTNGGPALGQGTQRNFAIKGSCGVPTTAKAVTINVTVTAATAGSFLTIWPAGTARPTVSTINFNGGDTLANGAIVGLAAGTQDLAVFNSTGTVHVIIDVTGYFQ
jgi:hypothetical protein